MHRSATLFLFALFLVALVFADDTIDLAIANHKRQDVSLSTGGSGTTTSPSTTEASTTTTSDATTSEDSTSTVETVTTSDTSDTTSTVFSTSTSTPTKSTKSTASTTPSSQTSTAVKSLITSFSISSSTIAVVTTFLTVHNGISSTLTSTSSKVVAVSTSSTTSTASLSGNTSSGGSSGLSSSSKATIGSVVGGVGGVILLGGIAFAVWRVWGKKRRNEDDDDMYDPNANQMEKTSSSSADSSPFKQTLDQYHTPGPVNTASNF